MAVDLLLAEGGELPPEGKTLDYKRDLSGEDNVLRTVIAFANSAGGQLVVGVADDHAILGVPDPATAELKLANLISASVRPQLVPTLELVSAAGQTVLVANVPVGSHRPYYLKSVGRYQGTFVRLGSSNRQATAALVDDLARTSGPLTFDRLIAAEATMEDLDIPGLSAMLKREVSEEELITLELAKRENGELKPTNGGLLVACRTPQRFFPHAWVQCARFRGPDGLEIADQANVYGPLPLAVGQVMGFLRRHRFLRAEFDADGPGWDWRRQDVPSIPEASIRELVINALVHSSYSYGGSAIKVAFWDEAVTIENPGGLVPGVTIDQITRGVSVLRNPVVARVFREMGLIESWGAGLRKAIHTVKTEGFGTLDIEELHERLRVTVRIPNHDPRFFAPAGRRAELGEHSASSSVVKSASGSVVKSSDIVVALSSKVVESGSKVVKPIPVTRASIAARRAEAVLRAALEAPQRRTDLLAAAGLSQAVGNYQRHIVPLVAAGLLARTIPDKPNSSQQRYTLTAAGREYLAARGALGQ
ncbi:MAG: putative DNA binding domain-containing protein [Propionibacteriaceae bacterium]|jgi:predicted HTH transcriptional regulator|nr:putative DNA binding domain-containing protein [Propionibacteriaceae bacterium]